MIKPPIVTVFILGLLAFAPLNAGAADRSGSVQGNAEREIARREDNVNRANKAIELGDNAMKSMEYDVAVVEYKAACDLLPESPITHDLRARAVGRFSEASVKLAEQRIAEGRFADAEAAAKQVVDEHYNPTYRPALQLLSHLEDPGYYNKTVGPKFYGNVQEVKKLFIEAEGFYDTGRYDLAYKRYEQILNIDPYNIAARKGEEKVNNARENYANQSYNNTRSYMNWQVTQAWDRPVRKYSNGGAVQVISSTSPIKSTAAVQAKLERIIIPKIEFHDATVREAVDFLKQKSRELDTQEPDPARRGVNIVLKLESTPGLGAAAAPAAAPAAPADQVPGIQPAAPAAASAAPAGSSIVPSEAKITLSLTNIPLSEALRYITNLAGLKVKIDPYAVTIVPLSEPTDTLITKEYKVPPGFISTVTSGGATTSLSAPSAKAGASTAAASQPSVITRETAQIYLAAQGVVFGPGASANYLPQSSRLIVRNTEAQLDLVDQIVEIANSAQPVQVNIEAKFVEIQQQNSKELSFDWAVSAKQMAGSGVFVGGGDNTQTALAPPFPAATSLNSVTSGNRSGSFAIQGNAIDALLAGTPATVAAPGIASIAGVLTNPQFQLIIRGLNQKKGVDLLSAPSVTTKSGQRATIEIIREFRYPTEFQPPQVPQSTNGGSAVVTPTTPTAFETRNTGVTLEVEPVVGPDGQTIDLNLVPQVVEFEGFINYGSPIFSISVPTFSLTNVVVPPAVLQAILTPTSLLLTNNVINQPIFSTRKVTTSVTVWDGQTVVLGGLIREDVQKVEDKVPIAGDIPLIGRLFRSAVDQHLKRNLIIFVSARLFNPAGEAVHSEEEKEEEVAPLAPPESLLPPPLPEAPLQK